MTAPPRARPPTWVFGAAALLGAALGAAAAPWLAQHLAHTEELGPEWEVVSPGLDAAMQTGGTDGSGHVDGALVLAAGAFDRKDLVSRTGLPPVSAVTLQLAPWSAPVRLGVRTPDGTFFHATVVANEATQDEDISSSGTVIRSDAPIRLEFRDGNTWHGTRPVGPGDPGVLELSSDGGLSGTARAGVRWLEYEGADGQVLAQDHFDGTQVSAQARAAAALGGAIWGLAAVWVVGQAGLGGALAVLLLALPPAVVLLLPLPFWASVVQRLYLIEVPPSDLRLAAFVLAFVPTLALAILRSGALVLARDRRKLPNPIAGVILLGVAAAASRDLPLVWAWLAAPGAALLAVPLWTARRAGQPASRVLLRDLPALVAVAVGTWTLGLLPLLAWRGLCLIADVRSLNRSHPRAGADALLITILALPVGAEAALRGSDIPAAWARAQAASAEPLELFWSESCGGDPQVVSFFGGSSLGGAYQFGGDGAAFPPKYTQDAICETGLAVSTRSYADSGRDTHDIARDTPALFQEVPPAVVVLYVGVNDLLTKDHPQTRLERAQQRAAVPKGTAMPALIRGLALALRAPPRGEDAVIAVPLHDAEVNLRKIAAATADAGGHLLLVPELASDQVQPQLAEYWALERRLAEELDNVTFFDSNAQTADLASNTYLADRNHLTRDGARWLGQLVAPEIARLMRPDRPLDADPGEDATPQTDR